MSVINWLSKSMGAFWRQVKDRSMTTRVQIQVRGVVQGVGFRPFVFSLAERWALRGRVFNNGAGVQIDVEGEGLAVERFIAEVESNPPTLSAIESVYDRLIVSIALRLRVERRLNRVVLSGGVFQNMYLLAEVCRSLESNGFDVFTHRRTPANDGGVSLGQAAVANARLAAGGG